MFNIENDGTAKIAVNGEHITLRAILLLTETDNRDTLLSETKKHLFRGNIEETEGHIFILTDRVSDKATVFIVATPDCVTPSIRIEQGCAYIKTHGYPVAVGTAYPSDAEKLCRYWYCMQYQPDGLHTMSNTWGDRNGRTRVNDEFIRREIDSGADLGLDVVQIDDGWQTGIPDTFKDDGLVVENRDFWRLKEEIFPWGMESLSEYAKERGVELGLWFAPDSRDVFKNYSRDISVLKNAYNDWKIKYFKLDMVRLREIPYCERMLEFLDDIFAFGSDVSVELDVTADKRLGYLMSAPYGRIFVENRYTAWGNYYPHRTLSNIWTLSRFIPTSKFQFELVNPDLCTDKYSDTDPLRPELYDIDYLFASVMLTNPLFWMETQFLSERNRAKLKNIISIWKKYRGELVSGDVYPIGDEPDGFSTTGFVCDLGQEKHLILFRECTEAKDASFGLDFEINEATLIASNTETTYELSKKAIKVSFGKKRSYVWLKIR